MKKLINHENKRKHQGKQTINGYIRSLYDILGNCNICIMKPDRKKIHQMFDGHCAYCGKEIDMKQLKVDHVKPVLRNEKESIETHNKYYADQIGKLTYPENDSEENLFPSCARCNTWKGTWSVEQFREQILLQVERLEKYTSGFRLVLDYSLIVQSRNEVMFYFEKHKQK